MASHSSTLAQKIPWMEEPGRLQSMGSLLVGCDCETSLSLFTFTQWRRQWQPTPVFLPGESQGPRSLVGCRLWGGTESDTTEATQPQQQQEAENILHFLSQFLLSCLFEFIHQKWVSNGKDCLSNISTLFFINQKTNFREPFMTLQSLSLLRITFPLFYAFSLSTTSLKQLQLNFNLFHRNYPHKNILDNLYSNEAPIQHVTFSNIFKS